MKIKICAIEKYLPKKVISSEALDELSNGIKGRIEKNTGVKMRHHISEQENVSEMAAIALRKAIEKAKLNIEDIDLLIFSGASFDYPVPHTSVIIKSKLTNDKVNFPCFDIDSTCLSFINALDIAHLYLEARRYKRIAIVSSEVASIALTPRDEKVFGLFGDAAVACILESNETEGYKQKYIDYMNFPSGAMMANVGVGGVVKRGIHSTDTDMGYYFKMDGKNLIRLTIKHLDGFIEKMEKSLNLKITEFDSVITHQTSKFGNNYFINQFKLNPSKVVETLSKYGNCISASIPLGLEHYVNSNKSIKGKQVLLLGSAAGVSLGQIVLSF